MGLFSPHFLPRLVVGSIPGLFPFSLSLFGGGLASSNGAAAPGVWLPLCYPAGKPRGAKHKVGEKAKHLPSVSLLSFSLSLGFLFLIAPYFSRGAGAGQPCG